MNMTVMEATAAITAAILWLSIIDIAILVNVACWYCTAMLVREIRRIK